jgi:ComF family protein
MNPHEHVLCTSCVYHLPRTNYWKEQGNPVEQIFWGRVRLEHACAFFFFSKGSRYRKLLHQLKYHGKKEIGVELGRRFGLELKEATLYQTVDCVVPVPLHPKKQRKRGYNQSEQIAAGITGITGWALDTESVIRNHYTDTQTRKSRMDRWENVSDVFTVRYPERLRGKHVLLIDDVVTTGATIEACTTRLLEIEGCRVSVATLAYAK